MSFGFQSNNGRSDLSILLHDGVIILLLKKVFAIHGIRVSLNHLDISKSGLEVDGEKRGHRSLHHIVLTSRGRFGVVNLDQGLGFLQRILGSALLIIEALVLALPPPFLVSSLSTLRLSLLPSNILSSNDEHHLGIQSLSSASSETHQAHGDGVDLGTVAELLLNEIGAAVHL